MTTPGPGEGIHVLEDFACEAIPGPTIRPTGVARPGRNEGMSVVEELVFDGGTGFTTATSHHPADLGEAIRSEAGRLAALLSMAADPVGTATLFQKLLLDELATRHRPAAGEGSPA